MSRCVKYELIHPGPRWFEGSFRTLYRVDFPQGVAARGGQEERSGGGD